MTKPVLLLTRPEASAYAFAARLSEKALERVVLIISPVLEIVPSGVEVIIGDETTVIFTSINGVENAPPGAGRTALCVGERTTERARYRGWVAELAGLTADDLVQSIMERRLSGPFLHLVGVHQRGEISVRLRDRGIMAEALAIYDQQPMAPTDAAKAALTSQSPVFLPVFSPRSAAQLVPWLTNAQAVHAVAISAAAAAPLAETAIKNMTIAPRPTGDAMRDCLENILLRHSLA